MRLRPDNPLRQSAFRRLWCGHLVSLIGDQIFPVALVALAIGRGGQMAETISVIFAARFLALALFIVIGGVVADRINRVTGMIALDVLRAVAVVAMIVVSGAESPLAVLAMISFVIGAGEAIFTPLYESTLPDLVEPSTLQRANSLSSLVKNLSFVIGPGIAGVLVAGVGVRVALIIDVATFAVSALALLSLRGRYGAVERDANEPSQPMWRAAAEGVRVVLRKRWLTALEAMAIVHTLLAVGPWYVLVPVLAVERYGSVAEYGLLVAAFGAGGVAGALGGARVNSRRRGLIAMGGIGSFGFACLVEGWDAPLIVVAAVFALAGFGTQMFDVVKTTAIQEAFERRHLGRVFSLDFFASFVTMPVGQVIGGLLVSQISASVIMRVCGVLVIVTTLIAALVPGVTAFRDRVRTVPMDDGPGTAPSHPGQDFAS